MRGKSTPHRKIEIDPKFHSLTVAKFINKVMLRGQKQTARNLVYKAFDAMKEKTGKEPLTVFETSLKNASPLLEVRSRRIGGATYQVPMEITPSRRETLAMRWIIGAARSRQGTTFDKSLADELLAAFENTGTAIKMRENMHRMAEANKAFAHYARF